MPVRFFVDPEIVTDENAKGHSGNYSVLCIFSGIGKWITGQPGSVIVERWFDSILLLARFVRDRHEWCKQTPYHLVEASPWPAVGSAAAFTAAVGGVMYMHEVAYGVAVLALGFALVLATMFMWWRDIIREAEYQGHHTPIVQIGMRYGMMLFIASEVMFL